MGFINFTVRPSEGDSAQQRQGEPSSSGELPGSVIVLGAGLAGLAAARQLKAFGYHVVILESQERAGGRVHTIRLEAGEHEAVGDMGGAVITGIDGNPLAVLARQLSIPMYHIKSDSNEDCPLYAEQGTTLDPHLDAKASEAWTQAEDATASLHEHYAPDTAEVISLGTFFNVKLREQLQRGHPLRRILRWMYANTEFSAAALATQLSVTRWADDDKFEYSGAHVWLPGGNARLVEALASDIPILYNTAATAVHYGSAGVTVETSDGTALSADAVVVTVPLGVLKADAIQFHPPLPASKLGAIRRFGYGLLNKVVLLFPCRWWSPEHDTFGHIVPDDQEPGFLYLWYCVSEVAGGNMLAALVSGQAAIDIESMPDEEVMALVMARLRSFHPDADIPNPVSAAVTRWGNDPHARGSYSSVAPGCNGFADYQEMAANVDGRVFFAGEATTYKYPAQMHGAFDSGLREAAKVQAALSGERGSSANSHGAEEANAQSVATLEEQVTLALLLAAEFKAGADLDLGCCSAIHAVFSSGRAARWGILQVDVGSSKGSRAKLPFEFHLVPIRALMEVAEVKGSADNKLNFLMSSCKPPVQMHNRPPPTLESMEIMQEILMCRHQDRMPSLADLAARGLVSETALSVLRPDETQAEQVY